MERRIAILYINGLGDGSFRLVDRVVAWWWRRASIDMHHASIDWYDDEDIKVKIKQAVRKSRELMKNYGGVVLLGSSAGGSLALNVFYELREDNVVVVCSRARLRTGAYDRTNRRSLYRRAHLHTRRSSQSFYDSVRRVESEVLPNLTDNDKQRMLILSQLTDWVVPTELMSVEGVTGHRSIVFGHAVGYLVHMFANRGRILNFARRILDR